VFPGILASFANILSRAIDNIYARFDAAGLKGLGVALAERVSVLDRLGSYWFTGFPKSLMGSVLTPLGTIEGIEQGGWPFVDPRVLDLFRFSRQKRPQPYPPYYLECGAIFAQDLYNNCVRCDRTAGRAFCSQNATWFSVLRVAVRHTGVKAMSRYQWIGALTVAMLACRIECMPGSCQSKLSYRRAIRLVGSAPPVLAIAARHGSLKRAAIEAEHKAKRPSLRRSAIPLTYYLRLGFRKNSSLYYTMKSSPFRYFACKIFSARIDNRVSLFIFLELIYLLFLYLKINVT
jgi:hypothetical protein